MTALQRLILWFMITVCPPARGLVLELYNTTFPSSISPDSGELTVGVDASLHCTRDPHWLTPGFPNIPAYEHNCLDAMTKAIRDLQSYSQDIEYEFLTRGAVAQTTGPRILLPRKYVANYETSESVLASCTVAIAMINSLEAGEQLPGQPPGPFGSSDTMTIMEILYNPGPLPKPLTRCIRRPLAETGPHEPSLGWAQAGKAGNVGIFYMGTRSVMDRRIARALHPNPVAGE